jgi:predicted kinase
MKEIVIVMGLPWLGKIKYILEKSPNYQLICPKTVEKAMNFMKLDISGKYLISEVMTRTLMLYELPIAVIETELEMEAIFIWKKIAVEHEYKIKVLLVDLKLEECFTRSDKRDKESLKYLSEKSKKFEQLKNILNMEHQSIVDDVEVIKPAMEEDKDEIL